MTISKLGIRPNSQKCYLTHLYIVLVANPCAILAERFLLLFNRSGSVDSPRQLDSKRFNDSVGSPFSDYEKRLREMQRRNTLVPNHLKSAYPAETQLIKPHVISEKEIKFAPPPSEDAKSIANILQSSQ